MKNLQKTIEKTRKAIEAIGETSLDGTLQPHEAYAIVKESGLEELLKEKIDAIRDVAVSNLQHNILEGNEKSYKDQNFLYTVRAGATRYYFTDVPEVKKAKIEYERGDLFKKFKEAEAKYKTAFMMKEKGQIMVDDETGEIVDPSSVKVVYSTDSLSIKRL